MTVKVVNIRYDSCDFRCDRSTPLGNPFYMLSEFQRDEVCDRFHDYFHENLNPDNAPPAFLTYLDQIMKAACESDIRLGCWCAPKRCHCQTIADYINSQEETYCNQK